MQRVGECWGRYPQARQQISTLRHRDAPLPLPETSMLAYGNGRSYGDSCLNDGGTLLHTRALDRFIAFDPDTGILRCEAGLLLAEILDFAIPRGWFLPVTPGTKFVTVGGAIANDVHGKNHHVAGTFGCHVRAFELLRSDGSRRLCTTTEHGDWFAATVGGLGLTGVITWAEIALKRIAGPWLDTETHRFGDLGAFLALSQDSERDYEYTVAWIDCTARGRRLGRGLFMRGNHARGAPPNRPGAPCTRMTMPFVPPVSLVNALTLRPFNWLYFHRGSRRPAHAVQHYEPYFYPLDGVLHWNRMYGPRGFLQYQCVVPNGAARDAVASLLETIAGSGKGSFLAVLKQFGTRRSPGMLSFPRPGVTLALDFPNDGGKVFALLDRLDDIVAAAGGAVYPAKDARMSGPRFKQYFPAWEAFSTFIDPRMSSGFWRRVMA
ncbi:MAG: FAD-binding oxidoreductase [Alphaproteobacteria bacterium]|nr:FAD-binding oxidoreductase [Alphaproteobacteria bacterium]